MTHPLFAVMNGIPVNKLAAMVTSQKGCAETDGPLGVDDLQRALTRMHRKHGLMKHVLGVVSASQHSNLVARWKAGQRRHKGRPSRLVEEYVQLGRGIQHLAREIERMNGGHSARKARQLLGQAENAWRAEHPGAIWDGRQLVAPNGAVFSRAACAVELDVAQ